LSTIPLAKEVTGRTTNRTQILDNQLVDDMFSLAMLLVFKMLNFFFLNTDEIFYWCFLIFLWLIMETKKKTIQNEQ
jgi:hypothetical protein